MEFKEFFKKISQDDFDNVYVFTGEGKYYIDNSIKLMKSKLIDEQFKDMNYTLFNEGKFNYEKLTSEMETVPFFGEHRLIIIEDSKVFGSKKTLSEKEEAHLISTLKQLPETNIIIFNEKDIDKRRKFSKEVMKVATVVDFKKLTDTELIKWVNKKFGEQKKKISRTDLLYFCQRTGYHLKDSHVTLYEIENLIKSISQIEMTEIITRASIQTFMKVPIEENVFLMVDALNNKQIEKALLILDRLIENKESEIKILALISMQYRNMRKIKPLLEKGYTSKIIAEKLDIHPYASKKLCQFSRSYSTQILNEIIEKLVNSDNKMKRSSVPNRLILEKLFFDLYTI